MKLKMQSQDAFEMGVFWLHFFNNWQKAFGDQMVVMVTKQKRFH